MKKEEKINARISNAFCADKYKQQNFIKITNSMKRVRGMIWVA